MMRHLFRNLSKIRLMGDCWSLAKRLAPNKGNAYSVPLNSRIVMRFD